MWLFFSLLDWHFITNNQTGSIGFSEESSQLLELF